MRHDVRDGAHRRTLRNASDGTGPKRDRSAGYDGSIGIRPRLASVTLSLRGPRGFPAFAARATERLEDLGLRSVHCYASGLLGWRAARQPLVESAEAKIHTWGPVRECRRLLVDVEHGYGGVFQRTRASMESAGG